MSSTTPLVDVEAHAFGEESPTQTSSDEDTPRNMHNKSSEKVEMDEPMDEECWTMAVCSLARDLYKIDKGVHKGGHAIRLLVSVCLLCFLVGLQVFLLHEVQVYVCGKTVHDIRKAYDLFEKTMYTEHTLTDNSNHRGVVGTWNPQGFSNMTELEQAMACRIPFSQPYFLAAILFLWTLTCAYEIKKALTNWVYLIVYLPTVDRMSDAMIAPESVAEGGVEAHDLIIVGLTLPLKCAITVFIHIPRTSVTLWLLWLGCRWLLSTENFSDLILNAIALEFVLMLKETLYLALVPYRTKLDISVTKLRQRYALHAAGIVPFVSSFAWGLLSFGWVLAYVFELQSVLPDYKWDVHGICRHWIKSRYEV